MNKSIIAVLIIILSGLLYPFFISPIRDEMIGLQEEIETRKKAIEDVENFIAIKNDLVESRDSLSGSDIDKLEQILPETVNTIQIILDIQELALDNGLLLEGGIGISGTGKDSKKKSAILSDNSYDRISFSINCSGTYKSLSSFLSTLSESLTLFNVVSLDFSPTDSPIYNYNILLETYKLSDTFLGDSI